MEVIDLPLAGLKLVRPKVWHDGRGFLLETYHADRYAESGIDATFVQENHSRSARGTLRGLHFQSTLRQGKLVRVSSGSIFDVAVDVRPDSPTFGRWYGTYLTSDEHAQLYIPGGFAHGFCAMSDAVDVAYQLTTLHDPKTECGIRWNDPDIGVEWPIREPLLSPRDQDAESFAEYAKRVRGR